MIFKHYNFNNNKIIYCDFILPTHSGSSVNMEGAVPTEQEINQPKPSKRARTSFTADQLQVNPHHQLTGRSSDLCDVNLSHVVLFIFLMAKERRDQVCMLF